MRLNIMWRLKLFGLMAGGLCLPAALQAQDETYQFYGAITAGQNNSDTLFANGTIIGLTVTADPNSGFLAPNGKTEDYNITGGSFEIMVPAYTTDGVNSVAGPYVGTITAGTVGVRAAPGIADQIGFNITAGVFPNIDTRAFDDISFSLVDKTATVLSSEALPSTINFADWTTETLIAAWGGGAGGAGEITIGSSTGSVFVGPIPAPVPDAGSTAPLLAAAFGGMYSLRLRLGRNLSKI